jgi:hypothetical protein
LFADFLQTTSNALNRFDVFMTEVNSQSDRRRAEFAVTAAPGISHLPSLAPMAGGSAGVMGAMGRSDSEHKRALSALSTQQCFPCPNPQEGLQRLSKMVLSFKLEACATAPDTVVMKMQSVLDLCNACNSDTASCWWTCLGSTCPFRNAFEGHSDEDHRRVRKASQLDVVARAQSAQTLSSSSNLLAAKKGGK